MSLESIEKTLKETHRKWFYNHQSEKECVYGSDGVGHDFIHPADQLKASLRNLRSSYHAIVGMNFTKKEKEIELEDLKDHMESCDPGSRDHRRAVIKYEKALFEFEDLCELIEDRMVSLRAFERHAGELLPVVSSRYEDYDDAMEDAWITRILYSAAVMGHPLGQILKISILPERVKEHALSMLHIPGDLPIPSAERVLKHIEAIKSEMGVEEWKKLTRSRLEMTQEQIPV